MRVHKYKLIGKKFGRLLVINESGRSKGGGILWKCVCDCGGISIVTSTSLVSGSTKSCGCLHKEVVGTIGKDSKLKLVGKRFGRLLVVSETNEKTLCGHYKWDCLCDCGNRILVIGSSLKQGDTRSCGCLSKDGRKKRKDDFGVVKNDLALYDTYSKQLYCEETNISRENGLDLLKVKCAYCGKWFTSSRTQTKNRLLFLNGHTTSENRFYCSENCKISCPIYGQQRYPKDFKKGTSREVSTYLRQMVFERDNWECQKCGKTIEVTALHCHHIKGYAQNKILANDVDNCITLCKECHKSVHKLPGCSYYDLRCESLEKV